MLFYYDLNSPYAWLAAERIGELAGADVRWVPILVGAVFKATGRRSWGETEARAAGKAEIERRARERGLPPVRWPEPWPNNSLGATRVAVHAHAEGRGEAFALAAFRASFLEARPLSETATLARAAERAGLDVDAALAAAGERLVKERLRENTDRAVAEGVFGVPTFRVGDELFWGDDRLEAAVARSRQKARSHASEARARTDPVAGEV